MPLDPLDTVLPPDGETRLAVVKILSQGGEYCWEVYLRDSLCSWGAMRRSVPRITSWGSLSGLSHSKPGGWLW